MSSEWKVQSQYILGERMYCAYRIKNIYRTVHSGNMEHYGSWSTNREEIQAVVDELNKQ